MREKKKQLPSGGRMILLHSVPLKYTYCLNNYQQVTDYTVMKKKINKGDDIIATSFLGKSGTLKLQLWNGK